MDRFKLSVLKHIRNEPQLMEYNGVSDDQIFRSYVFQMGCYALATPKPDRNDVRLWRNSLVLNLMLGTESFDPRYPGQLYEYLPDHDIDVKVHGILPEGLEFKPGDQPEGIDMSVQIVPAGQHFSSSDTSHRFITSTIH